MPLTQRWGSLRESMLCSEEVLQDCNEVFAVGHQFVAEGVTSVDVEENLQNKLIQPFQKRWI